MPKISALAALTAPANDDLLAIVDTSGATTNKITRQNFFTGAALPNNTVTTAAIADSAVTPAKLLAGTGTSWTPQSWTPTFTNLTGGTLNQASYVQIGKKVFFQFKYTLAGAGVTGSIRFTLPVAGSSIYSADTDHPIGTANLIDSGTQLYRAWVNAQTAALGGIVLNTVSGSNLIGTAPTSATAPFTWGSGDYIIAEGTYEAA